MNTNMLPFRTNSILVQQPFGSFYVASLPASLLLKVARSEIARAVQSPGDNVYHIEGTERINNERRHEKIGKFIDTDECTFPTSIILAANYIPSGVLPQDDERRWEVIEERKGEFVLSIPSDAPVSAIVDGQHRLHGFNFATRNDLDSIQLACSVFFDLPNPYQAYLFATVNYNQKKVDRGLAFELFGFDVEEEEAPQWTPEKLAVFLCRKLNSEKESPLRDRIKISAQDDRLLAPVGPTGATRKVSTATVVDGILSLVSTDPLGDRTKMHRRRDRRSRKDLSADRSPLRSAFLQSNDLLVYTIVRNFFVAVKDTLWNKASGSSYITRTVGIQACFDVLKTIVSDFLDKKTISVDAFSEKLNAAAFIEFGDQFFQASGIGRTHIRNILLLALRKTTISELPDKDKSEYRRLLEH
jgi:DNA phosphorothioation-associated DGQHR protein 1